MVPRSWSMVVLIGVLILLFAAPKLPQLARSLGQALRIFKTEIHEMRNDRTKREEKASKDITHEDSSLKKSSLRKSPGIRSDVDIFD